VSEIDDLQSAFEIPDDDWSKIVALAASLGTVPPERQYDRLGRLATYRWMMMSGSRPSDDNDAPVRRRRAAKIVTLCDALLLEIGSVPAGAALTSFVNPSQDEDSCRWLEELRDRARIVSNPVRPLPHNVDIWRDLVWQRLIEIFEGSTGRPARVSIGAAGTKHAGNGYGKIVDFIQAFAAVVPGSPIPTAHQIRAFEKKCRDKRRMASELPKNV
jgi:hypothetical protein